MSNINNKTDVDSFEETFEIISNMAKEERVKFKIQIFELSNDKLLLTENGFEDKGLLKKVIKWFEDKSKDEAHQFEIEKRYGYHTEYSNWINHVSIKYLIPRAQRGIDRNRET